MSNHKASQKPDRDAIQRKAQADLAALEHGGEGVVGGAMRNAQNAEQVRMKSAGLTDENDELNDPAVLWGKRIGRGIGYILLAYILYSLVSTYLIK